MSKGETVRIYLVGKTPEEAAADLGDASFSENFAQEVVEDDDNIYAVDLTIFASRLKKVDKWT